MIIGVYVSRTFSDTSDESELMHRCEQLAQMLSTDLKEEHVKVRKCVIMKLHFT